jgi:tRNA U34 5-methylaminomethyl-2-thiouridine-forming methyltransferase MnmC
MKIIDTGDGSRTLFLEEINETYHSKHGAVQESLHVFIKNGLRYMFSEKPGRLLRIFELGLGTGLNALLTANESAKYKIPVEYTSLEPFPVPIEVIKELGYDEVIAYPYGDKVMNEIHECGWEKFHSIHSFFKIRKIHKTIRQYSAESKHFNLVYFDAFAPNKQPEIWQKDILRKVYDLMTGKSALVTYCAKGQVKRDMKDIGYTVHTLQGPLGKKEMIRGFKD